MAKEITYIFLSRNWDIVIYTHISIFWNIISYCNVIYPLFGSSIKEDLSVYPSIIILQEKRKAS